jgi:mRNA interferase YafQ
MATPAGLRLRPTKAFDRDLKRVSKRGDDRDKLRTVIERLRLGAVLEPRHRDHALGGDWQGWRDCHVEPDWLLIYRVDEGAGELVLGRTDTHADLFEYR